MEDKSLRKFPYKVLGDKLRALREKERETVHEVSGAVEIETEALVDIEAGLKLPSEDILLLLISHFGLKQEEAMKLWKLAGYSSATDRNKVDSKDSYNRQSAVFLLPIDSRIVYTDQVQVDINDFGIVLNFKQTNSPDGSQPLVVARVGMSKEHAKNIISVINRALRSNKKPNIDNNKSS